MSEDSTLLLLERLRTAADGRTRYEAAEAVKQRACMRPWEDLLCLRRLLEEIARDERWELPPRTEEVWSSDYHGGSGSDLVEHPAESRRVAAPLEAAFESIALRVGAARIELALAELAGDRALAPTIARLRAPRWEKEAKRSFAPPLRVAIKVPRAHFDPVELPLRLVFLGDYDPRPRRVPLAERAFFRIDRESFDRVLHEASPELALSVMTSAGQLAVHLRFRTIGDFEPAAIAAQVPEIAALIGSQSPKERRRLSATLDAILHHPAFRSLESAWRSLRFVVDRIDFRENIKLQLLSVGKEDLARELGPRPAHAHDSLLHDLLMPKGYISERALAAGSGTPVSLIVADYQFGAEDLALLEHVGAVAASLCAPFVAAPSPSVFGAERWSELADPGEWIERLSRDPLDGWYRLRMSEEGRFVGLAAPRFLLRSAHRDATLPYEETIANDDDYLWGNAAFAFAARVASSFAHCRATANVVGLHPSLGGIVSGLGTRNDGSSTEIRASIALDYRLSRAGFIALMARESGSACFLEARSLRGAVFQETADEAVNAQLPCTLFASQVAHGLWRLYREQTCRDASDVQRTIEAWLSTLVDDSKSPPPAVQASRPFRRANARIMGAHDDGYLVRLWLEPRFARTVILDVDLF